MEAKKACPVVEVGILDPDCQPANFSLVFYGVPFEDFLVTPGGGSRIRNALERRGLHGYTSSPFLVNQLFYK